MKKERITDVDLDASIRVNERNLPWLPRNKDHVQSNQRFQLDHLHNQDSEAEVLVGFPTVSLESAVVAVVVVVVFVVH